MHPTSPSVILPTIQIYIDILSRVVSAEDPTFGDYFSHWILALFGMNLPSTSSTSRVKTPSTISWFAVVNTLIKLALYRDT